MLDNLYMIVAATEKSRGIGREGHMLYHLKEDINYFKEKTEGHTIVCGRRTYYTFQEKPLPNRTNVVLTRSNEKFDGCITMNSRQEVLDYAKENPNEIIYIVGGDYVYSQFINQASRIYVTEIEENSPAVADVFFPKFDKDDYNIIYESEPIEQEDAPRYRYVVYERKREE